MEKLICLALVTWLVGCAGAARARAVTIRVDCTAPGQVWEGWGATDLFSFDGLELEPEANAPGRIPRRGRQQILRLYYHEMGMTRVRFFPTSYEPENDNDDPLTLNEAGFVWGGRGARPLTGLDPFCEDHLVMGRKFRSESEPFTFYASAHQWERWMSLTPDARNPFFGKGAQFNPALVEEYAEHALAAALHIKEHYRYELPFWSLFNEPTNTARISKETTLALVLAVGRRFRDCGLKTKLAVCDDVTPEASAEAIQYVLSNEEARDYVGAVSYHRYCGDFVLERVKPMLAKVARGEPLVVAPVSFYESARKYGKSVWLSEQCSYGDEGITHFDAGRARANHICDEINHGLVDAFDFMLTCFVERGRPGNEEAPIFLRFQDGRFQRAEMNDFGHWLRHFTRYIRPGATRLSADVDDSLLKAVAFRHARDRTLTLVVVSNREEETDIRVRINGIAALPANAARVRTQPGKLSEKLPDLSILDRGFSDRLPASSITTYVVRLP